MGKISNYTVTSPQPGDILIGTDVNDANETKNFQAGAIASLNRSRGSFYHSVTQTAAVVNTAYGMRLATTDTEITSGFSIANNGDGHPTRITAENSGVYNLAFSAQLSKTGGGEATIDIWIRINGSNVASSNTSVTMKANANYMVAAWNFFVSLNENDYVEIMWATTDTGAQLLYEASNAVHPATPSVIATINQI